MHAPRLFTKTNTLGRQTNFFGSNYLHFTNRDEPLIVHSVSKTNFHARTELIQSP